MKKTTYQLAIEAHAKKKTAKFGAMTPAQVKRLTTSELPQGFTQIYNTIEKLMDVEIADASKGGEVDKRATKQFLSLVDKLTDAVDKASNISNKLYTLTR